MRILPLTEEALRIAAEALRGGLLVAFPTETVYGLGADGVNPAALARVFEAKGRPRFDPLILHIASWDALSLAADLGALGKRERERAELLGTRLWPGPLTLILPKQSRIPDLATAGLSTVAVRLPDHPGARRLIAWSTGAVAAPSANPFGRLSPTRAEHVADHLGEGVDLILDGGPVSLGVESTVLDLCSPAPRILRPGGMSRERIEALIGPVARGGGSEPPGGASAPPGPGPEEGGAAPRSPGQLSSHYAPRTPLRLRGPREMIALPYSPGEGYLFFDGPSREAWFRAGGKAARGPDPGIGPPPRGGSGEGGEDGPIRVLSESGSLTEAASRLFAILHLMDRLGLRQIHAQEVPERGLGPAINDRLRRGSRVP